MANRYQSRNPIRIPNSTESDPLAELARLIGQADPHSNFGRAPPPRAAPVEEIPAQFDTEAGAPPAPPWIQAVNAGRHSPAAAPAEEAVGEPPPQPRWMRSNRSVDPHAGRRATPYAGSTFTESAVASPSAFAQAVRHDEPTRYASDSREAEAYGQQPHEAYQQPAYDDARYGETIHGASAQQPYPGEQYQSDQYQYEAAAGLEDGQYDPNAYQHYEDAAAPRRRSGVMTVAAVLALAVVGTAAAYGYRSYKGSPHNGEPPIIKAEAAPIKVVPPTSADASGKIVDRIGGGAPGTEKAVSREEQPMDVTAQASPRVVFPPLNQNATNPPAIAAPATQAQAAPGQSNGVMVDEPRKVRTVSIRPDQPETTPAPRPAATPRTQAPQQVASASAGSAANAPMSLSPQAAAPAAMRGGYVVQVAAQRSEADAQTSFRNMQARYPSVLASRSAIIRRVDLGQKGVYYRAMVGPFASSDEASHLCGSLKSAGGQCVVQRN
jgi:hypothetical protein